MLQWQLSTTVWRLLYFFMALGQLIFGVLLNLSTRNNITLSIGAMSLYLFWLMLSWLRQNATSEQVKWRPFAETLIIQFFLFSTTLTSGGVENPLWWLAVIPLFVETRHLDFRQSFLHFMFSLLALLGLLIMPSETQPLPLSTVFEKVQALSVICAALLMWITGQVSRKSFEQMKQNHQRLWFRQTQKDKLVNLHSLTSALLHKMGTPLNAAMLDIERELNLNSKNENLADAMSALESCEQLLRQINLAFENQANFTEDRVDLTTFLKEWFSKSPQVTTYLDNDVQWRGDTEVLKENLDVLIQNALEFAGTCQFRMIKKNHSLAIDVIDQGPGFPTEVIANWGQPYNSSRGSHHGMGLYNVYLYALSQGGKLSVENLSKGARVRLELPYQTNPAVLPVEALTGNLP